MQPNSAILFSGCENGGENERCITGIAMVDECFWGKECTDGQIKLHSKHKLMLSDENKVSFWKYFKRETFPAHWGKVPFKYFQNQSMRKILFDICEQAAGTEQEEVIIDFYRYFCSINRISDD